MSGGLAVRLAHIVQVSLPLLSQPTFPQVLKARASFSFR